MKKELMKKEVDFYVSLVKDILNNSFDYNNYTKDEFTKSLIDNMIRYEEIFPNGTPIITYEAWSSINDVIYNFVIDKE